MATRESIQALVKVISAIADTIKELKEVPSGVLYAQLMGSMSLDNYQYVIGILKQAGKVTESNNVLSWVE